jgi:hypothetical protein
VKVAKAQRRDVTEQEATARKERDRMAPWMVSLLLVFNKLHFPNALS